MLVLYRAKLADEPARGESGNRQFRKPAQWMRNDNERMQLDEKCVRDQQRNRNHEPAKPRQLQRRAIAVHTEYDAGAHESRTREKSERDAPRHRRSFALVRALPPNFRVGPVFAVKKDAAENPIGERGDESGDERRQQKAGHLRRI